MRPATIKLFFLVVLVGLLSLGTVRAYADGVEKIEILPINEELEAGKSIKVRIKAVDKAGKGIPNAKILAEATEEVVATIEPKEAVTDNEGYVEFTITGHDFYGVADFEFRSGYARMALHFDYEWEEE